MAGSSGMALASLDRAGRPLAVLPSAVVDVWGERLNAPGALRFALPAIPLPELVARDGAWAVDSARCIRDVLDPDAGHEVAVRRRGRTVWQGPLLTVAEDDGAGTIQFAAEGLLRYLQGMHVTTTLETAGYPASDDGAGPIPDATVIPRDQHLIVQALIDHGQSRSGADFGLDTSQIQPSGTERDRQYKGWEAGNVWGLVRNITELASMQGGCDIAVDPATRQVRLWTPRRGRRRHHLVFDARNVRGFRRELDKTELATEVIGIGAGEGSDMLHVSRSSARAIARVGRLQHVMVRKDVSRRATLRDHADAELAARADLPSLLSVTVAVGDPRLGDYELGDEARIHYPSAYEPVDEWRRIIGIDVRPGGGSGGETVADLHLERLGAT